MRDTLDLRLLLRSKDFEYLTERFGNKLVDAKEIYEFSRKLTMPIVNEINKRMKIRKAQISKVFDIILLGAVDQSSTLALAAYEGFLRKKLERVLSQDLFTRVKEKHVEFEGKLTSVDYKKFVSIQKDCKHA